MFGAFVKDAVIDGLKKLKQSGYWIISKRRVGYVALGPAHGDFPGSPHRFTYRFQLTNGAIETLEITV